MKRNPFKVLEKKFKLHRTSGDHDAPGVHAEGSFHYRHASWGGVQAYDYGTSVNDMGTLKAVGQYIKVAHPELYAGKKVRELFGPFDFHIKNGVVHKGAFPGHRDHVHLALSD